MAMTLEEQRRRAILAGQSSPLGIMDTLRALNGGEYGEPFSPLTPTPAAPPMAGATPWVSPTMRAPEPIATVDPNVAGRLAGPPPPAPIAAPPPAQLLAPPPPPAAPPAPAVRQPNPGLQGVQLPTDPKLGGAPAPGTPGVELFTPEKIAPQGGDETGIDYAGRKIMSVPALRGLLDPTIPGKLFDPLAGTGFPGIVPLMGQGWDYVRNAAFGTPNQAKAAEPAPPPVQQSNVFADGAETTGKAAGIQNIAAITADRPPVRGQRAAPTGSQVFDVDQFMANVSGSESGGNPLARNPGKGMTASGLFQFTRPTWLGVYKKMDPKSGLSDDQIWSLRDDTATQQAIMRQATNSNVAWLKSVGVPVNYTTAGITHFLGAGPGGDAAKLFRAARDNPDAPLQSVISDAAYKANPKRMAGMTVGQFMQNEQKFWNGPEKTPAEQLGLKGWDPTWTNQALGMLDQANEAANHPQGFDEKFVPTEEVPKPPEIPKMDWTKPDEMVAQMRPEELTEAKQQKMRNNAMWKAAAMALVNMPDGAGIGGVLAGLGGGLLAGKMTGNEEIDKKLERIEERMALYKGQMYRHETAKAQNTAQELGQDVNNYYNWQLKNYANRVKDASARHGVEIDATGITYRQPSADGKFTEHRRVPNQWANQAATLIRKAGVIQQAGNDINSVEQANNRYAIGSLAKGMGEADPETLLKSPSVVAQLLYDANETTRIIPPEKIKEVDKLVQEEAVATGNPQLLNPTSDEYGAFRRQIYVQAMEESLRKGELADGGREAQSIAARAFGTGRVKNMIDTAMDPTRKQMGAPGFYTSAANPARLLDE